MSSREVIKRLQDAGWYLAKTVGDHHQFKHPEHRGKVTVPHPVKDLFVSVIKSIEKQSGVKLRE
ncbi:type II toxin-antitoxin system HicA family toxin [Nitratidesulfovibrio sp. D1]|uniref:type II toxin-antitoxin system HicA family toxin n=1 Tax=Nitratidesulfovibrio sp. D1 TaxID=3440151 RepID=UPI003EB6B9AF